MLLLPLELNIACHREMLLILRPFCSDEVRTPTSITVHANLKIHTFFLLAQFRLRNEMSLNINFICEKGLAAESVNMDDVFFRKSFI